MKMAQKEFSQLFPKAGWVEHDPLEILSSQLLVIKEVVAESGIDPKEIAAAGITNQRETVVVWNKETGNPIYNAIVWQDNRTAEYCNTLKELDKQEWIQSKTGLLIDSYFSATKIKWILDNIEGARQLAETDKLIFGTVDSWLIWKITSGEVHATDVSNASRTMLFNIHTLNWDPELFELFDIPISMASEVKDTNAKFGNLNIDDNSIPIQSAVGDQQAALFGQQCFKRGMAKNTYGTGCFMLMNTGRNAFTSKNGLLTTIAWKINDQVTYALEGSVFIAGAAIQWLRDSLEFFVNASDSETLATSVENSDQIYVIPAFNGMGAPYWNMRAKGAIFGLTRGTNKAHITRATLESLAYQTRDVLEAMENDTEIELTTLKVDGGATKNNYLMQFQSDVLQVPVQRPDMVESTAFGTALLAGLGVGFWSIEEIEGFNSKGQSEFKPILKPENVDGLYFGWKNAVNAVLQYGS